MGITLYPYIIPYIVMTDDALGYVLLACMRSESLKLLFKTRIDMLIMGCDFGQKSPLSDHHNMP